MVKEPPSFRAVHTGCRFSLAVVSFLTATLQLVSASTFVIQPGPQNGKDTCWGTEYAPNGTPDSVDLYTGGWGDYYYDYFEFDLTGAPSASATATATITFWMQATGNDPAFELHRITQPWTEASVTRLNHPNAVYERGFGSAVVVTGFQTVDVTNLYKAWRRGDYPNYGIELVPTNNDHTNGLVAAAENPDPTHRPRLEVTTCASIAYYRDVDQDGYGDPAITIQACVAPAGYVANATDCDDSKPSVHPGAPEFCDGIDNQCPGDSGFGLIDQNDAGLAQTDTDGDGLWDCWELYGIDINGDGIIDLPLNSAPYHTDRLTKDLFVEVDYMAGSDHSHLPLAAALDRVQASFWENSVSALGEHQPIRVHWIIDEPIQETPSTQTVTPDSFEIVEYGQSDGVLDTHPDPTIVCNPNTSGHFGSPSDRNSTNCQALIGAKSLAFRYLLMAHDIVQGAVGWAPPRANGHCSSTGFLVAQGNRNSIQTVCEFFGGSLCPYFEEAVDRQAGTIMHELGHTLGLNHGGATDTQCKPNYLSVMNYSRMINYSGVALWVPGVPSGTIVRVQRDLNYSSEALNDLDESTLVESDGVGSTGSSAQRVIYGVSGTAVIGPAHGPIDWNASNTLNDPVSSSLDINAIASIPNCDGANDTDQNGQPTTLLRGHHDWATALGCLRLPDTPTPSALVSKSGSFVNQTSGTNGVEQEPTEADYLNGSLGRLDADGDGIPNTIDRCPLMADPAQLDGDGDGIGDSCDCLPADVSQWGIPSEVFELGFYDKQTLQWREPGFRGAGLVQYDTLRATTPSSFADATCVEAGDDSDLIATDLQAPSVGQAFYYLIRPRDNCPNGNGSLGSSSDGTQRLGSSCPPMTASPLP